jgi:dihydropteroate synthase
LVMGIVNVTPDSFSDGGQFEEPETAITHALKLEREGADIIDIGGESSRPGAVPVPEAEELRRVLPVIEGLRGRLRVPISIDTMKPGVAQAALAAGAAIVNDVAANRQEETMWDVVAARGAGYVCLHMRGTPQTMQAQGSYADVAGEVKDFFFDRIRRLSDCGVSLDQIILDPGIGFGKQSKDNLRLLRSLRSFVEIGRPILLGVSRKSFIGKVTQAEVGARLPGALACACLGVAAGVQMFRVHEVAETIQAIRVTEAILEESSESTGGG